ncbi:MAG TPA: hypothetical protein VN650_10995 [Gemmatimonadaceae bacterium]|nr:hypothetical protein [Gemmatimonadaceae bacterium]
MQPPELSLIKQLDLACGHRDLAAARRISRKLFKVMFARQGTPFNPWRAEDAFRLYADRIHQWDIQ